MIGAPTYLGPAQRPSCMCLRTQHRGSSRCYFTYCYFTYCYFTYCYFTYCYFAYCYFTYCYFTYCYFTCCYFTYCYFTSSWIKINMYKEFSILNLHIIWVWLYTVHNTLCAQTRRLPALQCWYPDRSVWH